MVEKQGIPDNRPGVATQQKDETETRRLLAEMVENIDYLIHEIRTPLTAVISSAEFLMGPPLSPQEQEPLLNIIHQEALRINGLLENFHRLHHQESGAWLSKMTYSAIQVADLLHEAAARFRNASPKHLVRLELGPGIPPVQGDRLKLELVLRNLLANAIKYSPAGGTILLSAGEGKDGVVVCVRDQGMGIPAENLVSIFERNYRINRPEYRKMRGSGQGLAIVARIVANHGGTLRVESEPGRGSAFFFTLPKID